MTDRGDPGSESLPEMATGVAEEMQDLVALQIELAKQEFKELAVSNAMAVGMFGAAAILALAVLVAVPVLIAAVSPWLVSVIVVAAYLALAVGLALFGKARLRLELPRKTIESLKENKEWALRRMKSRQS
jgi:fatty acid desaturase